MATTSTSLAPHQYAYGHVTLLIAVLRALAIAGKVTVTLAANVSLAFAVFSETDGMFANN